MQKNKTCLRLFKLVCLIIFLIYSNTSKSQGLPKLGLTLSGGGAKGLAHIGILKAMEDAGIYPDIVTGTSMGSIIGALYASGYSADEIKKIALAINWDEVLKNSLYLSEVVYQEKDYYGRYWYEMNFNGLKPELPKGLIDGQKLSLLLSRVTWPVMNINDFKKLPIPFACNAANIENGDNVILNNGNLPQSLRASMAIPTVFTPIEIDKKLLVDGGLVHNFPVQENIDMGATYNIGVFVGNTLFEKEQITSPLSVLTQSVFLHVSFDTEKQKQLVDFYIEPNLKGYSAGDFKKSKEIIEIGEECGKKYVEKLKLLNDSLKRLGKINHKATKPHVNDTILLKSIKVINNKSISDDFISGRIGLVENKIITLNEIEKGIIDLYGTGYFSKILYNIDRKPDGDYITIDAAETPPGKVKVALQYDRETGPSLTINLTYRDLLMRDSRTILEGEISENSIFDANFLKYFGSGHKFSFSTGYFFRNSTIKSIDSDGSIDGLVEYNFNRLNAGFNYSGNARSLFQLNYYFEFAKLNPKILSSALKGLSNLKVSTRGVDFGYEYNTMQDRYFPSSGSNFGFKARYSDVSTLNFDFSYSNLIPPTALNFSVYNTCYSEFFHSISIPLSRKISLINNTLIAFSLVNKNDSLLSVVNFLNQNYIGGFRKLAPNIYPYWGAEPMRYYSQNLFSEGLTLQFEPKRNLFIQMSTQYFNANPFGIFSVLNNSKDYYLGGKKHLLGFGALIGYRSPIGPISFAVGKGSTNAKVQYTINIGYYFDRK